MRVRPLGPYGGREETNEVTGEKGQRHEQDGDNSQRPHNLVHLVRRHLCKRPPSELGPDEFMDVKCWTYVERVVDQVFRDAREHLDTGQDVIHVVVNVSEVNLGFMGHVTLKLLSIFVGVVESDDSVDVVPTHTVDQGLDWSERPLV